MVDFKQLKDKAQGLLTEHSDKIQEGITKAGGFAGNKVGHDKVDPIEAKLKGFVDKAAGKDGSTPPPPTAPTPPPSATPNPPPPSTPNPPPTTV
jgi:hypothetical protein